MYHYKSLKQNLIFEIFQFKGIETCKFLSLPAIRNLVLCWVGTRIAKTKYYFKDFLCLRCMVDSQSANYAGCVSWCVGNPIYTRSLREDDCTPSWNKWVFCMNYKYVHNIIRYTQENVEISIFKFQTLFAIWKTIISMLRWNYSQECNFL